MRELLGVELGRPAGMPEGDGLGVVVTTTSLGSNSGVVSVEEVLNTPHQMETETRSTRATAPARRGKEHWVISPAAQPPEPRCMASHCSKRCESLSSLPSPKSISMRCMMAVYATVLRNQAYTPCQRKLWIAMQGASWIRIARQRMQFYWL